MKLRIARHTTNIDVIQQFYVQFLGLERLGEFHGHDGYDGIFIGHSDLDWHLEFTVSDHAPDHKPDDDDLLVFYIEDKNEFNSIVSRGIDLQFDKLNTRNPYWDLKGNTYEDPDGFRVVIVEPA